MLFTYTLSHRQQLQRANFPGPHVPLRCRRRGLRLSGARPAPPPLRRSLGRDSQPQAARRQRRPRHGGSQEREDYRNDCGLHERLGVPRSRHYKLTNLEFTSRELTAVPYDGAHGAFSDPGDSGSITPERGRHIVALLTDGGSGGITDTNTPEVTFCTPYCELKKRIKEVLPGVRLLD
jgi:hypothetical protein